MVVLLGKLSILKVLLEASIGRMAKLNDHLCRTFLVLHSAFYITHFILVLLTTTVSCGGCLILEHDFSRYAQQTDAGQLTRSLLLEPRATVNVKPNLQIIADDVKCSHGAAISDLEETQLFYFQARGIDLETARKALIFSFGAEVIERLPSASVRKRVENHIKDLLNPTLERS